MPKNQKHKSPARRAVKTSAKHFSPAELAELVRATPAAALPTVNLTALRFCALALASK